jgi:hypothetical protein
VLISALLKRSQLSIKDRARYLKRRATKAKPSPRASERLRAPGQGIEERLTTELPERLEGLSQKAIPAPGMLEP